MVRLERAVGAAVSIIGVGIAVFTTFCVAYYFMPNMTGGNYSTIEAVLASWMPQIITTAMLMILSIGLVKLGSSLMRHAAPEVARATEREEALEERGPPPFMPPRPPEAPRTHRSEESLAHMAFEAVLREERPPRPPAPSAEGRAPPKTGPPAEKGRTPEARPALDEDELSRIIRILRERRKRT